MTSIPSESPWNSASSGTLRVCEVHMPKKDTAHWKLIYYTKMMKKENSIWKLEISKVPKNLCCKKFRAKQVALIPSEDPNFHLVYNSSNFGFFVCPHGSSLCDWTKLFRISSVNISSEHVHPNATQNTGFFNTHFSVEMLLLSNYES